jgi:hypothetical protein
VKTLLLALGALALVGCSNLKPVGVLSKETPLTQQGQPLPNAPNTPNTPTVPARPPMVRPTPPTMNVTPNDVDPNNPYIAAGKLSAEVEIDSKSTVNVPVTAEISRYKDGVRQP